MKQKIFKNIKNFAVSKAPQAAKYSSYLMCSAVMTSTAMAAGNGKAGQLMGQIIGTIGQISTYVGAALFAQGMFQLVMAFKDDNADSKSKAIMFILSSLILMTLPAITSSVITSAGVSGLGTTDASGGLL